MKRFLTLLLILVMVVVMSGVSMAYTCSSVIVEQVWKYETKITRHYAAEVSPNLYWDHGFYTPPGVAWVGGCPYGSWYCHGNSYYPSSIRKPPSFR